MTAAQKKAKDNFKKAIAYRKKTGCTLKQAFAHVYGKKSVGSVKKKAAPKKKAIKKKAVPKNKAASKKKAAARNYGSHKDTASHNVRISVVSGINNDVVRSINNFKKLELEIKEAQKNYNKAKDFTQRFYAKQKLDKLKYELRERKFVLTNLSKELKKVK